MSAEPESRYAAMAETSFGYGCWSAPFWFLGPEQGMSKCGSDTLEARFTAWQKLGSLELDDCKRFHEEIGWFQWHAEQRKPSGKPYLQSTWRRLIAARLGYEGKEARDEDQWAYQREHWGRHHQETCVIELSGIAANSLVEQRERNKFLDKRLENVIAKVNKIEPAFLIVYGKTAGCKKAWAKLASDSEHLSSSTSIAEIRRREDTLIAWTGHPTMQKIRDWHELGYELKRLSKEAA